jgi:hypothetical protein
MDEAIDPSQIFNLNERARVLYVNDSTEETDE